MEGRPLEPTEADLVERARRGDAQAYADLVRRYQEVAFRTAYLIVGDGNDAADVAQNAFLKAYRGLARFRSGTPLRPWLLRIVGNEARNQRRAAGRRMALTLRSVAQHASVDAAPSAEAVVLAGELRRRLVDALNQMREQDRLVIGCRYFLDLSEAETAEVLGVRGGTVKSRLSRALDRLRLALRDETHG